MVQWHCSKVGVSPLLKDYGENRIDSKMVKHLYVDKFLPINEIAKRLKVSRRPILRRLHRLGIVRRPFLSNIRRKEFSETIRRLDIKLDIWRAKVFERDGIRCVKCGTEEGRLEAHHIIPVRDIETEQMLLDINNGITLCIKCHRGLTYHEYEYVDEFRGLISKKRSSE